MLKLTRQEQRVLTAILGLLLLGLAVRTWRLTHSADPTPLSSPNEPSEATDTF